MATLTDAAAPAEIKVLAFFAAGKRNKRKNYVPRRIVQREPLTDITNKTVQPAAEPPRAVRRRITPTPIPEARASHLELLRQALYFIYTVDMYAIEYKVAPLLDMMEVFKANFGAVGRRRTVPPARRADQDAGREAHARPAVL